MFALEGAFNTIQRCRPVIAIENCAKWLARYGKNLEMIENFLNKLNYVYFSSARGDRIYIHSG